MKPIPSETEQRHRARIGTIKWILRVEVLLWVFASIPSFSAFLVLAVAGPVTRPITLGLMMVGVLGILLVSIVFDAVRSPVAMRGVDVPPDAAVRLLPALRSFALRTGLDFPPSRIRVVLGDISNSAHVRGVVFPRIVISGGLMVGLMRGNDAARAIFAHELAHIINMDKFLPGAIVIALGGPVFGLIATLAPRSFGYLFGQINPLLLVGNFVVLLLITVHICHRREFLADAIGTAIVGTREAYLSAFSHARRGEPGGFFHPPTDSRRDAVNRSLAALRPSVFWIVFWLFYLVLGVLTVMKPSWDEFQEAQGIGMLAVGAFGLVIELVKVGVGPFEVE